MKRTLLISFLVNICFFVYAQNLPSAPASGFGFPIGSKFTLKLIPTDSLVYDVSVLAYEPFEEVIHTWDYDHLFSEEGEDNTINFYFCFGTHGETEEEKEKNMSIHLLMKNYSKMELNYSSDIMRQEDGEFEYTSNIGISPNAISDEMWPYMIYMIGLKEFRENLSLTQPE